MAEPGKKPFDYARARADFENLESELHKRPVSVVNAVEQRLIDYERANRIKGGVGAWEDDDFDPLPEPAAAAPATPQAPSAPQQQAPAAQPQDIGVGGHLKAAGKGIWSALAGAVPDEATDIARGAGQGFSFSRGDEAAANVAELASVQAPGDASPRSTTMNASNRVAVRGPAALHAPAMSQQQVTDAVYEDLRDNEREANAAAEERSPWGYNIAKGLAMTPAAVASAPAFGVAGAGSAGAGLGTLAARTAAQSGALGALDASGRDVDASGGERLQDAAMGGTAGALGGGAGVYAGAGGAAMAGKAKGASNALADWARSWGLRNRAAASGVYGGEMAKMTAEEIKRLGVKDGRKFAERVGETIERYGAHKRPESGILPRWVPQSPGVYADTLETATKQAGREIGRSVDDATAAGARTPAGDVSLALRDAEARQLAKGGAGKPVADAIDEAAQEIAAEQAGRAGVSAEQAARMNMDPVAPRGDYTPRELWDKRHAWKNLAQLDKHRNVTTEGTARAQGYREARDALDETIRASMTPDQLASYASGNRDYAYLQKALNASTKREAQELGNQVASINTPGMAAAGATLAGAPGAAASIAGIEAAKRVGRDVLADTGAGMSSVMRGASQLMGKAEAVPAKVQASGAPGGFWGALAGDAQPNMTPAYAAPTQDDPVAASVEEEKRLTEQRR